MGRIERSTLTFSSRTAAASKRAGASMAVSRQELHQVVLEHVAHHARRIVVAGAVADGRSSAAVIST